MPEHESMVPEPVGSTALTLVAYGAVCVVLVQLTSSSPTSSSVVELIESKAVNAPRGE
jgi:hypothetical protein